MTPANDQAAVPAAVAAVPVAQGAPPPIVRRNKRKHGGPVLSPLPLSPPIPKRPTTHVSINVLASQMGDVRDHLEMFSKRMSATGKISQQDLDNLMKEEKIRIAMEKLASAQMQKVNSF